jgi:hypothetical protein
MRYDAPLGTDSLILSLKALFDGSAAADLDASIALHLGDERFQIRIADGQLAVARGEVEDPDATLETDQTPALVAAHRPPTRRGARQRHPPASREPRGHRNLPAHFPAPPADTDRRAHVLRRKLALLCDAVSRWVLRVLGIGLVGPAAPHTADDLNLQPHPPGKADRDQQLRAVQHAVSPA